VLSGVEVDGRGEAVDSNDVAIRALRRRWACGEIRTEIPSSIQVRR
jgi:hypothetical protein